MNETPIIRDETEPLAAPRGIFNAAMVCALLIVMFGGLGCRSTGGWEYSGEIPMLGKWSIKHTIEPSAPGKPVDLTFVDPIMNWIVGPITGATGADGSTQAVEVVGATTTTTTTATPGVGG